MDVIVNTITVINDKKGAADAPSNTLEYTMFELGNMEVNLIRSKSRVENADFPEESMKLAKARNIGTHFNSSDYSS